MSKNKDRKLNSPSKALLYSEILNTSVTDHVQELLQKKKKGSTFHVQRSSVLDKVSKLLQSLKEAENDVKNIEIVEDGEPFINMSVTLTDKVGSECESDDDIRNADFENGGKDKKLIIYSDSDSDTSNGSEEKVLDDRNLLISDSESELCEDERDDNVFRNMVLCSDVDIKDYEIGGKTIMNGRNLVTSSDSDDNPQENEINVLKEAKVLTCNSNSEQFDNKNSVVVLEDQNNEKFQDSDDELSNQECCEGQEKYLKHPKLDLELTASFSPDSKSKNQNHLHKLGLSGDKKRKLIYVIEDVDEQNTCLPTKQKRV